MTAKAIIVYHCKDCRQTKGVQTEWKLKRASKKKIIEKRNLYFTVEKILDHKADQGTSRKFLIKWKNFSATESSWEPEAHLDGCLSTLQGYCEDNGIPYSKIEGFVGAVPDSSGLNDNNWVKPSTIVSMIKYFLDQRGHSNVIPVEVWDKLSGEDTLYIVPLEGHCYVVLYYAKKGFGYIADGGNNFIKDRDVEEDLSQMMNLILVPRKFDQQHGVDHCGSSAVVLSLEMINQYRLNIKPDSISVNMTLYKKVKALMHPDSSAQMTTSNISKFQPNLKCEICGKKFGKGRQRAYKRHIATHRIE